MYYFSELNEIKKQNILKKYNFNDKYFKFDITDEVIVTGLAKLLKVHNFGVKYINFVFQSNNPNIIKLKFIRNDKIVLIFEHLQNSLECSYKKSILKITGDNYYIACRILFSEVVRCVINKLENNNCISGEEIKD